MTDKKQAVEPVQAVNADVFAAAAANLEDTIDNPNTLQAGAVHNAKPGYQYTWCQPTPQFLGYQMQLEAHMRKHGYVTVGEAFGPPASWPKTEDWPTEREFVAECAEAVIWVCPMATHKTLFQLRVDRNHYRQNQTAIETAGLQAKKMLESMVAASQSPDPTIRGLVKQVVAALAPK